MREGEVAVRGRALEAAEMGVIAYKVLARGYMKWVNYKQTRGHTPVVSPFP